LKSRIKGHVRRLTENYDRWSRKQKDDLFRLGSLIEPHARPKIRGDCRGAERPCPYVGCKYHTYLDVKKNGNIEIRFPDIEPGEMETPSCVLDVADWGGAYLEEVGTCLNITRERARQVQDDGLAKMSKDGRLPDE